MDMKTAPLSLLNDPTLLKTDALINGHWVKGASRFDVHDPATGKKLADVANLTAKDAEAALDAANAAWPAWRSKTGKERSIILRKWFDLLMANQEDLGRIMTAEQGKPFAEAKGEVAYGASFVEWFAEEAKRVNGETLPQFDNNRRLMVLKQPIGVCAAITPWNFPLAMITRKVAPALAAGCPVVIKPAELTPLTALAAAELAMRAGIPAGVLNILSADSDNSIAIGKVFCSSDIVRHISFTGSTEVGRILMAQSAPSIKKLALELGGNAPFIVFDDADIDSAVEGAMASKYRNAGQTCVCANRIYVQDAVYDEFVQKFSAKVKTLKVGNGFDDGVVQGPLIEDAAIEKVQRHVQDAIAKGGKVMVGGHKLDGQFFEPTVIADASANMLCAREETFGPFAPVFRFHKEQEAIDAANNTEFGLASYFYSRDIGRIYRVGEALEYGMVGINVGIIATEHVPFGGVKQSGLGREGSSHGMDEYLEMKYLCLGDILK
ncbi:MAG: succinate-semialdehyde dehydrogenase (NADP(+)) [Burkholderiales bacterium 35-55-47]|jgi:succinate-semialdehyde dehydrogenase/glutarate-semialdehyde dehydrogenase|uniref:NAD-dependent succinate-semialdehyde dehydrogenase n=1 Tax=Limnohabitans sp. TaxID=1907725 RepID=UPI000BD17817|nr:NAD-dependent succinate-semialdehyde dehydrogenase [Limnohabitans sp.]OYY19873.1 MAG: succinate-semialdehyde dehydrogenase (NADP(+)) [Burkholderiales bacterium 35-55-47]OYZ74516.1 MAG: succinate-semialdehyde dehydrogenase (NADP(+)) [Burkholderiales bacterium 24-55-52]OZB01595.1 MAG: succinate-semialdehyde dehydrogenase (NADP(+)) [Burkholderiales bacterium 39-55-53]HQR86082.1 NAD-dependent succinate-semialdehyde dehydrogenase [Limnohabitans sp.]HQS26002.1 NAD-dependent succinate-semialdehyde